MKVNMRLFGFGLNIVIVLANILVTFVFSNQKMPWKSTT